jgi:hypothetical protein
MRIRRLVEHADEQHREAMRSIADDLAETHFGVSDERVAESRRRFVRQLGLGGAVALGAVAVPVAALTSRAAAQTNDTMVDADDTAGADDGSSIPRADLDIVEFAESLELSAQAAYEVAGGSPLLSPAEVELCATFGRHHGEHAAALGTLLADAGVRDAAESGVPIGPLVFSLSPQIQGAADASEVLTVMLSIEEGAAATYLSAIGTLESESVAAPAASIMPIEAQHAAVLGELLELAPDEWLPTLQSTDGAFDPADYAG